MNWPDGDSCQRTKLPTCWTRRVITFIYSIKDSSNDLCLQPWVDIGWICFFLFNYVKLRNCCSKLVNSTSSWFKNAQGTQGSSWLKNSQTWIKYNYSMNYLTWHTHTCPNVCKSNFSWDIQFTHFLSHQKTHLSPVMTLTHHMVRRPQSYSVFLVFRVIDGMYLVRRSPLWVNNISDSALLKNLKPGCISACSVGSGVSGRILPVCGSGGYIRSGCVQPKIPLFQTLRPPVSLFDLLNSFYVLVSYFTS